MPADNMRNAQKNRFGDERPNTEKQAQKTKASTHDMLPGVPSASPTTAFPMATNTGAYKRKNNQRTPRCNSVSPSQAAANGTITKNKRDAELAITETHTERHSIWNATKSQRIR